MDVIIKDCVEFASVAFRPNALSILLYVARQGGEAQVNNSTMQMSRQAYRTAVDHLKEAGLITSRQTQWGSIITLGPNKVVEPYSNHMSNHITTTSATTWESETRQDIVRVEDVSVNGEQPHEQPHGNHMSNHIALDGFSPDPSSLNPTPSKEKPPKGVKKKSPPKRRLPQNWYPTNPEYAIEHGIDPKAAVAEFTDWAISKGHTYADWERTFQRACRSWLKEKGLPAPKAEKQEDSAEFVEWLKETYPPIYEKLKNKETIADYYRNEYTSQS